MVTFEDIPSTSTETDLPHVFTFDVYNVIQPSQQHLALNCLHCFAADLFRTLHQIVLSLALQGDSE